ncbi:unnamed protein product, partial [Adineta steineri]
FHKSLINEFGNCLNETGTHWNIS